MDETEENERSLQQILDGYDFMSSADSDIKIMDQQPTPSSSSSFAQSSYLSPQSTVSNINGDAAINETASIDSLDRELDERTPDPPVTSPTNPSSPVIQASQAPDSTTIVNFYPITDTNQVPTMPSSVSHPGPPQSDFVFKPLSLPKILTHNDTTQPAKIVKLSSQLPTTTTTSSSSSDVQGRTFISKGGDVRIDTYFDSDLDLQDIIQRLNTNKNKKRRFKPRAPASRNIKQQLTWIAHNITQTMLDKVNLEL